MQSFSCVLSQRLVSVLFYYVKVGIKMQSFSCVLSQWLVSVLFIASVPTHIENLIQNSQAVKKVCGPQKGYGEKRCEIQGGGQEMAVMVG